MMGSPGRKGCWDKGGAVRPRGGGENPDLGVKTWAGGGPPVLAGHMTLTGDSISWASGSCLTLIDLADSSLVSLTVCSTAARRIF